MSKPEKKSWEKRLSGRPDDLMTAFVESLSVDRRLYMYDIVGSVAHAKMLAECKLITRSQYSHIKKTLVAISEDIAAGKLKFDPALEDIHMAIERELIRRAGQAGECLHTGRSRNDQVATDMRLWMRDEIEAMQTRLTTLQKSFVALAGKYTGAMMPAYTHLQRAQPIAIGAYLLSFVEQFERDIGRFDNCRRLLNVSPLGSGAVAGSTLPLDRSATCRQLGFSGICGNSIDAVGDRDFCAEFIFDCAMTGTHLSRLAEDWIIYSSQEFGFLRIDDSFCTSSSMMPQKRNPDALELIRARTGGLYGNLMAMLTVLKAQPTGYNRDLQEDKVHVFTAADTLAGCLDMAVALVAHTTFLPENTAAALSGGFTDATALAEYLVLKKIPFRQAHGIVGTLVAHCEKSGSELAGMELAELKRFCPAFGADVYECLGAGNVAAAYRTDGAAGHRQAAEQTEFWKKRLAKR